MHTVFGVKCAQYLHGCQHPVTELYRYITDLEKFTPCCIQVVYIHDKYDAEYVLQVGNICVVYIYR